MTGGWAPPPGPVRVLAGAQLANSLGDGAFYACSALFFTRVVGLSPAQVGYALMVGWGVALLAGVPLGQLADRFGPRRVTLSLSVATAGTLGAFLFVGSFPALTLVACGYACCQAGLAASRQALLATLVPPGERTAARAHLQAVLNAGLALGAGLGALALTLGTGPAYRAVFVLDASSFLAAALVLRRLPGAGRAVGRRSTGRASAPRGGRRLAVLRDRSYALVALLNAVLCLNMPLLSFGLPLWVARGTDAPAVMAAVVLVGNMLAVVVCQVRVARRVTDLASAARATRRAGWLLCLACLGYALSGLAVGAQLAVVALLLAAGVQVYGEMLHGAGSWEIGFGLARPDQQGQYQGLFAVGPQLARMLGPALLTLLLISWGPPGWLVLGGLFLAAGAAFGPVVRHAERAGPGARTRERGGAR